MEDNEEEDLGVLDDQRSIILHLLSQLKLGMDLTRVRALKHWLLNLNYKYKTTTVSQRLALCVMNSNGGV